MDGVSSKLIQRIREEFEEAPWLRFTVDEAAQFWGLDRAASEQVLTRLIATGFLVRGIDQRAGPRFASTLGGADPAANGSARQTEGGIGGRRC